MTEKIIKTSEKKTRREFIKLIGKSLFTMTILSTCPTKLFATGGDNDCSSSPPDINCGNSAGNHDEACEYGVDTDNNCSPTNSGANSNADVDNSCGANEPDESCEIFSTNSSSYKKEEDEHCSSSLPLGEVDNCCGDCDDNHDSDSHCGVYNGVEDQDQLCGHTSWAYHNEDQSCGNGTNDEGCGTHDTTYGGADTDTDNNCNSGGDPDNNNNCNNATGSDSTCDTTPEPAYGTNPDEMCSTTDVDNACGQGGSNGYNPAYDEDQDCSNTSEDNACGADVNGSWSERDESCGQAVNNPTDENCDGWFDLDNN